MLEQDLQSQALKAESQLKFNIIKHLTLIK